MELLVPTRISNASFLCPCPNLTFNGDRRKFRIKPIPVSSPLRVTLRSEQESPTNEPLNQNQRADNEILWGKETNSVEVIGIGSRKDAILDFCLDSPFQSSLSTLRFWTVFSKDSSKMQLQQRSLKKDMISRDVILPASQLSTPRAVILVASAGYGLDHIAAIELLRTVKAANGLAVGIILRPFSFEGQRRQDEVKEIVDKVQGKTNFCIVVDTDALLKKDVVTLSEALKSANNAVLLAINCIFILMSGNHTIHFDHRNNRKELEVAEVTKLLESFEEAKVGFGAGNNIKSSIARAVFDCPFIDGGIKNLNGMVVCTLASAAILDGSDLSASLHTFRQTTGWQKELIFSIVREPDLEPNLFVVTVIVLCVQSEHVPQKNGFLSGLALRFPFVFSLLRKDRSAESQEHLLADSLEIRSHLEGIRSSDSKDMENLVSVGGNNGILDGYSEELQTLFGNSYNDSPVLSGRDSEGQRPEVELLKANEDLILGVYDQTSPGNPNFEREALLSWKTEPGLPIKQERDEERATVSGSSPMYTIPVGVKSSKQLIDSSQMETTQPLRQHSSDDMDGESLGTPNRLSLDVVTDAGLEAVTDAYNAASTILKGKYADASRKQGVLSKRAASMLEAERDLEKKWSPIMEMQYRGGIYRGRCQGGLPEGKGRLTLVDGSIYDGMWRYGNRSGLGTFYYSNGDVFQGSWRDDLMHGKGWFYFHSGDRWFANYWKGKANGEGRFYSKDGEIFFGHFKDGWRHGHSLCISVDGTRWTEIWDEGVLLSRQQLDS